MVLRSASYLTFRGSIPPRSIWARRLNGKSHEFDTPEMPVRVRSGPLINNGANIRRLILLGSLVCHVLLLLITFLPLKFYVAQFIQSAALMNARLVDKSAQ